MSASKALVVALVMTACVPQVSGTTTTTSTTTTIAPDPTVPPPPAATTTSLQPLVVGCPEEDGFVEGGVVHVAENPESDATTIGLISWREAEACETFEIEFETAEGAPATTPPSVTADFVDDVGVLRLFLTATGTVITDQLVETSLVDRLYVVRSLDGGMFIDFHLAAPTQARVDLDSSPARLTLQLQPGIVEFGAMPVISDKIILISPTEDSGVPVSLRVSGYARTFESNVLLIATQGDEVVVETNTTAADSVDTWGEFEADLELAQGPNALFVGEESAVDGRLEGVSIDLEAR